MIPKKMAKPAKDDRDAARPKTTTTNGNSYFGRDGLLAYIKEPETFPKSRVIYYNDDWVLIHDLYPKASVRLHSISGENSLTIMLIHFFQLHMLLLPRNSKFYNLHPLDAFASEPALLSSALNELKTTVLPIALSELQRLHGSHSASDQARIEAMNAVEPPSPSKLPAGRDYSTDLKIGVHANPSMNHLHIHILSVDMHSECVRHRQHYQSFNTEFFCKIQDMPLEASEIRTRREGAREALKERGMKCWRCGKDFGSKFKQLKEHLNVEYGEWRRE
jgi:aprataxin